MPTRKLDQRCWDAFLEENREGNDIAPGHTALPRRASPKYRAPWGDNPGRRRLRWRAKNVACAGWIRARAGRYSSLSEDSEWGRSFVSISSGSDSSIMGTAILYFPVAQLPRSRSRQRALQKGNSADVSESTGCLQIGHFSFTADSQRWSDLSGHASACVFFQHGKAQNPQAEACATLSQNSQRGACRYALQRRGSGDVRRGWARDI